MDAAPAGLNLRCKAVALLKSGKKERGFKSGGAAPGVSKRRASGTGCAGGGSCGVQEEEDGYGDGAAFALEWKMKEGVFECGSDGAMHPAL